MQALRRAFAGGKTPVPQLLVDFETCQAMHWSWEELQATPMWVRRRLWEFLDEKRKAENRAISGKKPAEARRTIGEMLGRRGKP